jgi:hypothetical protein
VQLFVRWKERVGGVEVIGITRLPIADKLATAPRVRAESRSGAESHAAVNIKRQNRLVVVAYLLGLLWS